MTALSCRQARELVSDYIDGELPDATARALEGHLETCPNCPPLYASLIQTLADLKALGIAPMAQGFAERVAAALATADQPGAAPAPPTDTGDDHG